MLRGNRGNGLVSFYLVGTLIIAGFAGLLVMDGFFDQMDVSAAGKNIYVSWQGHGNYTTIQEAIDNASVNDTIYVWAGIYHEDLVVNKTVKLIGNGTSNTTIYGLGIGDVVTVTVDWVNISGFFINNSGKDPVYWKFGGIKLESAENCNIFDNFCSENDNGITLENASSNIIQNNICVQNKNSGINVNPTGYVQSPCHKNLILNNNCSSNAFAGIYHNRGDSNKYKNNSARFSQYGFFFQLGNFNQIENNNCSNNQYGIYLFISDFNTINNNSLNHCAYGIQLDSFNDYNLLHNNTCMNNNNHGIHISWSSNNTFSKNNCSDNYWRGIYERYSLYNKFIDNNVSYNLGNGFEIFDSDFTEIINNTINHNQDRGIRFSSSKNLTIMNNKCRYNYGYGISSLTSLNSTISNNNCTNNYAMGIYLYGVNNFTVENNNCSFNPTGIYAWYSSNNTFNNNLCNNNNEMGIYLEYCIINCISNNTCSNNLDSGIFFIVTSNNSVENNKCMGNTRGIVLYYSNFNNVFGNYVSNYVSYGIEIGASKTNYIYNNIITNLGDGVGIVLYGEDLLWLSENNYISENTILNCSFGILCSGFAFNNTVINNYCDSSEKGISLYGHCINNTVIENYCSENLYGLYLLGSSRNFIRDNYCENNDVGIYQLFGEDNIIENNNSTLNLYGMVLGYTYYNTVSNNTCNSNNFAGIYLGWESYYNKIENNTCESNTWSGINVLGSYYCDINDNICKNNHYGINISYSYFNDVEENEVVQNDIGFSIGNGSHSNKISKNLISNNLFGIYINTEANKNSIFHNMIMSNSNQAVDKVGNNWNNSYQEGNYWSDYKGLDNGAGGRIPGDGIGDTEIPHLDLDYYPFMNAYGWLEIRAPRLLDPGDVDLDGTYNVSWIGAQNSEGYILEEDDNELFKSPQEKYNGSGTTFQVNLRSEGIYYYRVKSYNQDSVSKWSNIVDMFVDLKPEKPKNLKVSVWPAGNTLNISWDQNPFDVTFYELQFKTLGDWSTSVIIFHPNHTFNHTSLKDGIRYSYRLRARDQLDRVSEFSATVFGTPADSKPPEAPKDLKIQQRTYNSLFLTWVEPTDDDVQGYNIYRSTSTISQPSDWGKPINSDSLIKTTFFNNTPLEEGKTYYYVVSAVDEVPSESPLSNEVSERTYLFNEYPQPPEISNPPDDFNITEDTIDDTSINLFIWFRDVNNDKLIFRCEGQRKINVTINQETGAVTLQPTANWNGQETLVFHVTDGRFNVSDSVVITVTPVNDPPQGIKIISPIDGLEIKLGTPIDLKGECTDPDIPYGDILTFNWSSSISGELGTGETIEGIILVKGTHIITLTVSDAEGEALYANIEISVKNPEDSKTTTDLWDNIILIAVIGIIILIIILIIIFVSLRKKKREPRGIETSEYKQKYEESKWRELPKESMTQEELEDYLLTEEE